MKAWWARFRTWPVWAQVLTWALSGFIVIGLIGSVTEDADDDSGRETTTTTTSPVGATTTTGAVTTTLATTTTTLAPPTTAAPTTLPPVTAAPTTLPPVSEAPVGDVYYANCDAARAAGAAPLYTGDPGYRAGLDRDGDGVACET